MKYARCKWLSKGRVEWKEETRGEKAWCKRLSPWPWVAGRITAAKESRQSWNYCVFLDHVQTPTTNSSVIIATHSTILAYIDMKKNAHLIFRSIDSFHNFYNSFHYDKCDEKYGVNSFKDRSNDRVEMKLRSSKKDWIDSITTYHG